MPLQVIIDAQDLSVVGRRLLEKAREAPAKFDAGMLAAAQAVSDLVVPIMADNTPKRSGALADSTQGDVSGLTITIHQPAENSDGVQYVQWVVQGRGDVYPVNKLALASADGSFGPVKHAGPAAANPYPQRAMDEAHDPMMALLESSVRVIAREIVI